jgi:hypothetical protein
MYQCACLATTPWRYRATQLSSGTAPLPSSLPFTRGNGLDSFCFSYLGTNWCTSLTDSCPDALSDGLRRADARPNADARPDAGGYDSFARGRPGSVLYD